MQIQNMMIDRINNSVGQMGKLIQFILVCSMVRYANGAPCDVTDGTGFSSTEACTCGNVDCTVDTGLMDTMLIQNITKRRFINKNEQVIVKQQLDKNNSFTAETARLVLFPVVVSLIIFTVPITITDTIMSYGALVLKIYVATDSFHIIMKFMKEMLSFYFSFNIIKMLPVLLIMLVMCVYSQYHNVTKLIDKSWTDVTMVLLHVLKLKEEIFSKIITILPDLLMMLVICVYSQYHYVMKLIDKSWTCVTMALLLKEEMSLALLMMLVIYVYSQYHNVMKLIDKNLTTCSVIIMALLKAFGKGFYKSTFFFLWVVFLVKTKVLTCFFLHFFSFFSSPVSSLRVSSSQASSFSSSSSSTKPSGLFIYFILCVMVTSASGAPCNPTDGTGFSTEACTCGNVDCTVDTGLICYSTTGGGSCRKKDFGSFGYPRKDDGYCDVGVTGRYLIGDYVSCKAAAVSLGLSYTEAGEGRWSHFPRGCYMHRNGNLFYNTYSSSTQWCNYNSNYCICFSAPTCDKTGGLISNTSPCLCGTSACSPSSGLYCDTSTSTCSRGDTCSNIDVSEENSVACACGDAACNDFNGKFCYSSLSFCSAVSSCAITDGSAANPGRCKCENEFCTESTGLICYSTTGGGSCRKYDLGSYGYPRENGTIINKIRTIHERFHFFWYIKFGCSVC